MFSSSTTRTVLTFVIFQVYLLSTRHVNSQQQRPVLSFDDTLDDFLRQAQDTNGEDGNGLDIQVSTCKISSQQLVATAQATAARVLKGVCNPKSIEDRFNNLETQLGDQLNVVKAMLLSLEEKIVDQDQELKRQYRQLLNSVSGGVRTKSRSTPASSSLSSNANTNTNTVTDQRQSQRQIQSQNQTSSQINYAPGGGVGVSQSGDDTSEEDDDDDDIVSDPIPSSSSSIQTTSTGSGASSGAGSSSISTTSRKSGRVGPRSDEISRYNSTVHIEGGKRVFSFYWVVPGMSYKLNNWNLKRSLRSNSFYIYPGGYRMYMKILPRYTTNTMYIHAGITKGDYDDSLQWPFVYNMRAYVLGQKEQPGTDRVQDLKSRIWDPRELCSGSNWRKPTVGDNPECLGLGFPHDVIKTSEYIWNDRIILKLAVYLD